MKQQLAHILLTYFRILARLQLKKYAPDIVGITGSAGKSSTMNTVAAVLKDKYRLKVSEKANSETGIPLNILGLSPHDYSVSDWLRLAFLAPFQLLFNWQPYEKYVVEMGVDSPFPPKNMEYLLSIIRPRTGILLNIQPVHSKNYDVLVGETDPEKRREKMRQAIADNKGRLITSLPKEGLAILNGDDPLIRSFKDKTAAQVLTFGQDESNDVWIKGWKPTLSGTRFDFRILGEEATVSLPYLLSQHYADSLAAAACVAADEDFTAEETANLLQQHFSLPPGRASLFEGLQGSFIYDSSYNASTQPVLDSLELMRQVKVKRRLCLLGDMREMGEEAAYEHELIAAKAAEVCDKVYLVGPLMREHALPVFEALEQSARWFASASRAAEAIAEELKKDDLLLVKGSQNTLFLEMAVERLLAHKKDTKKLCRRGEFWDKMRARAEKTW